MNKEKLSSIMWNLGFFIALILSSMLIGGSIGLGYSFANFKRISPSWQKYELYSGNLAFKELISSKMGIDSTYRRPELDELEVFAVTNDDKLYAITEHEAQEIMTLPGSLKIDQMGTNKNGDMIIRSIWGETFSFDNNRLIPNDEPITRYYTLRDCASNEHFQKYLPPDEQAILDTVGIVVSTDIGQSISCYILLEDNRIQFWTYDYNVFVLFELYIYSIGFVTTGMIIGGIFGFFTARWIKNSKT